jgi:hypothetical protein
MADMRPTQDNDTGTSATDGQTSMDKLFEVFDTRMRSGRRARIDDTMISDIIKEMLEVRRRSDSGLTLNGLHILRLLILAPEIFRALAQPVADYLDIKLQPDDFYDRPVEDTRIVMARTIENGLPLPRGVSAYLGRSLRSLNAGYIEAILRKTAGRKGAAPHIVGEAKLRLLMWIRYQHGLGRKISEAQAEVASQIGRTYEAISKWYRDACDLFGGEYVASLLDIAQRIGRWRKDPDANTVVGNKEVPAIWEALHKLETDLPKLAETYRLAVTERRIADWEIVQVR